METLKNIVSGRSSSLLHGAARRGHGDLAGVSALTVCIIMGVLCLVVGICELARYFSLGPVGYFFRFDLALGLVGILAGMLLLIHPAGAMTILPIAAGFYIIVDSVFAIQVSLELHRLGGRSWWCSLLLGALGAVFGFLLVLDPFDGASALMVFIAFRSSSAALTASIPSFRSPTRSRRRQERVQDVAGRLWTKKAGGGRKRRIWIRPASVWAGRIFRRPTHAPRTSRAAVISRRCPPGRGPERRFAGQQQAAVGQRQLAPQGGQPSSTGRGVSVQRGSRPQVITVPARQRRAAAPAQSADTIAAALRSGRQGSGVAHSSRSQRPPVRQRRRGAALPRARSAAVSASQPSVRRFGDPR